MARWLAGDDTPPGAALRTTITGETLTLELLHDETWNARIAQSAPIAKVAESSDGHGPGSLRDLLWEKIEPGRFQVTLPLTPGRMLRGSVRIGNVAMPFGPLMAGSAEWSYDHERITELRRVAASSGGRERLDLSSVWDAPQEKHQRPFRNWILVALVIVLLIDAALTKWEIALHLFRRRPGVLPTKQR
jgi:hypothetical protein